MNAITPLPVTYQGDHSQQDNILKEGADLTNVHAIIVGQENPPALTRSPELLLILAMLDGLQSDQLAEIRRITATAVAKDPSSESAIAANWIMKSLTK